MISARAHSISNQLMILLTSSTHTTHKQTIVVLAKIIIENYKKNDDVNSQTHRYLSLETKEEKIIIRRRRKFQYLNGNRTEKSAVYQVKSLSLKNK